MARRRSGSVTTTNRWPWLKPALGARRIVPTTRSSVSRGTGSGSYARTMRRRCRSSLKSTAREYAAMAGAWRTLMNWRVLVPGLALVSLGLTWGSKPASLVLAIVGVLLAGSILAAVHHVEVVAHRVGEPFGALILAVAVTVIEVGLIVTLM